MKLFLDFLPLILFFGSFSYADRHKEWAAEFASTWFGFIVAGGVVQAQEAPVLLGTIVMTIVTLVQVAVLKATRRPVHLMLWITFGLVIVLGGATVWFHNPMFIKWKPSLAYWALGVAFCASRLFGKNLLQEMLGGELELPPFVWQRLNFAYAFSTATWASFKVFGATGLMLAFSIGQVIYLSRHLKPPVSEGKPQGPASS
jgi:intracellular septation protein